VTPKNRAGEPARKVTIRGRLCSVFCSPLWQRRRDRARGASTTCCDKVCAEECVPQTHPGCKRRTPRNEFMAGLKPRSLVQADGAIPPRFARTCGASTTCCDKVCAKESAVRGVFTPGLKPRPPIRAERGATPSASQTARFARWRERARGNSTTCCDRTCAKERVPPVDSMAGLKPRPSNRIPQSHRGREKRGEF
jgi:hypothetical protein